MITVKYNSQNDRISIAEISVASREDDLIERDFKCVSPYRLWSLLSGQKFKGMIFHRFQSFHRFQRVFYYLSANFANFGVTLVLGYNRAICVL